MSMLPGVFSTTTTTAGTTTTSSTSETQNTRTPLKQRVELWVYNGGNECNCGCIMGNAVSKT